MLCIDVLVIYAGDCETLPTNFEQHQSSLELAGLRVNNGKTMAMITEGGDLTIKDIPGREPRRVKECKYLASMAADGGALLIESQQCTKADPSSL